MYPSRVWDVITASTNKILICSSAESAGRNIDSKATDMPILKLCCAPEGGWKDKDEKILWKELLQGRKNLPGKEMVGHENGYSQN